MVRKLGLVFNRTILQVCRRMGRLICRVLISAIAVMPFAWAEEDAIASAWQELSITEQRWLAPVEKQWDAMPPDRQQRLRAMARRWENLPPEAQREVKAKINRWSKLDDKEKLRARENLSQFRRLSDKQRRKLAISRKRFMSLPLHKRLALRRQWEQLGPDRRARFTPMA